MEDEKIIALFWSRSEQAIEETAAKYGRPVSYTHLDVYKRQHRGQCCVIPPYRHCEYVPDGAVCSTGCPDHADSSGSI